jgi:cytidylate kinase
MRRDNAAAGGDAVTTGPVTFRFEDGERAALGDMLQRFGETLRHMSIAIDGPAGSGKSTTARRLAARLHLQHLDTGAMYRTLTLAALRSQTDCGDGDALARLLERVPIRFENHEDGARVFLGSEDVTQAIRTPAVTRAVSGVSALPQVRQQMVLRQRRISDEGGTVMEGRDIGTVVLPHADVKVFLVADARVRAARRQLEEQQSGDRRSIDEIESEIRQRDHADATRSSAPMRPADDAIEIDTSRIDLDEQVDAVLALALRAVRRGTSDPRFRPAGGVRHARLADWPQEGWRPFTSRFYRMSHLLVGSALRTWFGVRRHGPFDQPVQGSVLVACNHIAALDPPLVGTSLPFQVSFIAKRELFRMPVLGRTIEHLQAIPIRRGIADYEALNQAVELLRGGTSVLMFPEGTRQKPGRLGRPRWGFGYVAQAAGRPVVPMFLRGSRSGRPRFLRRHPLEVWMGEALDVTRVLGRNDSDTWIRIGDAVMQRIEGLMLRSAGRQPFPGVVLPTDLAATERLEASD